VRRRLLLNASHLSHPPTLSRRLSPPQKRTRGLHAAATAVPPTLTCLTISHAPVASWAPTTTSKMPVEGCAQLPQPLATSHRLSQPPAPSHRPYHLPPTPAAPPWPAIGSHHPKNACEGRAQPLPPPTASHGPRALLLPLAPSYPLPPLLAAPHIQPPLCTTSKTHMGAMRTRRRPLRPSNTPQQPGLFAPAATLTTSRLGDCAWPLDGEWREERR